MIELIVVVVGGIFGLTGTAFSIRKTRQLATQKEQFATQKAHQTTLEIRLAEIDARAASEQSSDALVQQSLKLYGELSANIQASTQTLLAIKDSIEGTQNDMAALRREHQVHMAANLERHAEESKSLATLPLIRADVQAVPQETVRILNESFKQVPKNTDDLIAARLNNVKTAILKAIESMDGLVKQDLSDIKAGIKALAPPDPNDNTKHSASIVGYLGKPTKTEEKN